MPSKRCRSGWSIRVSILRGPGCLSRIGPLTSYCMHSLSSDFGAHVPAGTPAQCASNYFVLQDVSNANKSTIIKTIEHTTLGECCAACTAENTVNETTCYSYTFVKAEKKCMLHGVSSFSDFRPNLFASSGFFSGLGLPAYLQRAAGDLSEIMNGALIGI